MPFNSFFIPMKMTFLKKILTVTFNKCLVIVAQYMSAVIGSGLDDAHIFLLVHISTKHKVVIIPSRVT